SRPARPSGSAAVVASSPDGIPGETSCQVVRDGPSAGASGATGSPPPPPDSRSGRLTWPLAVAAAPAAAREGGLPEDAVAAAGAGAAGAAGSDSAAAWAGVAAGGSAAAAATAAAAAAGVATGAATGSRAAAPDRKNRLEIRPGGIWPTID